MDNRELSKTFERLADLLEIKGENPFRVRSYRRAAQTIDHYPEALAEVASEGRLEDISGIGKGIAEKIFELLDTGELSILDDVKAELPPGLLELLQVPGLGPKKVKRLWEALGVTRPAELAAACKEEKVRHVPGMGAKSEAKILKAVDSLERAQTRYLLGQAQPWAEWLVTELETLDEVECAAYAGSARRGKETVGDIDVLVASTEPEDVMEWFRSLPGMQEVIVSGTTKTSVYWHEGIQVDLRVVPRESFGAALQYFTGSQAHNVRIREMASSQGYKVSEYGIYHSESGERLGGENEEDIYTKLGLQTPPPEMREDAGELDAAAKNELPALINQKAIQGDLHAHTDWSDGRNTLEEMTSAAQALGYGYLAITDHSQSLRIANGLSEEKLLQQIDAIREFNSSAQDFRLLSGTEVDITADGHLDFPDEILAELDVVVASIHIGLGDDRAKQTKRILAACENPHVDIIGHMSGRILKRRDPVPLDTREIFRVAAETGTAIEINANPYRLDLCDVHAREAVAHGASITISTDAHTTEQLGLMRYGISTAKRGWIEARSVLNTQPVTELVGHFSRSRE